MHVWLLLAFALPGNTDPSFAPPANLAALQKLTPFDEPALQLLTEQGLVVLSATDAPHIQGLYYHLELSGLPVYVTADAMLYLWYEAHREALMSVEVQYLLPQTRNLVGGLFESTQALRAERYPAELRANAVMLGVARRLLDESWQPPEDLAADVEAEVGKVLEHRQMGAYPADDYTQYTVRGHYAKDPDLTAYFRGTKYLARQYFRVVDERRPQAAETELRRAVLLALAMREGQGVRALHDEVKALRVYLAGPADTVGLDQLLSACDSVWGEGWTADALGHLAGLQAELGGDRYPTTRITNRAIPSPGRIPPRNVAILGEHWLPDSELFQRTIDPAVPGRALPTGLEVAAALGSTAAEGKLIPEAHVPPQVVDVVRDFGPQMRGPGVYGAWLDTLRELFAKPEGVPAFAQAPAYEEKQINACLTSWAQQRHNYILYGAQPYSVMGSTDGLVGIVEPLPGFWSRYAGMCGELAGELEKRGIKGRAATVLRLLGAKAGRFQRCAEDQLAGRDTSWAEDDITHFGTWIGRTIFEDPRVIADVCTDANAGEVLHAGSGPFRQIVVLLQNEGQWLGAVGYVGSYYEIIEPDNRLTDEEWAARFDDSYNAPAQPAWLGALCTPVSPEQAQAAREMAALAHALKADLAAGTAAVEQFVREHENTERAPEAIALLAEHLHALGQDDESLRVAQRARTMYGCDARDEALGVAKSILRQREWEAKQRQQREEFEQALAATDPREGLSEQEEIERQNQRAELLIKYARGNRSSDLGGFYRKDAATYLRRVLSECPKSGNVPFAEFALVLAEWDRPYGDPELDAPPPYVAQHMRQGFLELAARYADSAIGLRARTGAAAMLYWQADYRAAYDEVKSLLDLKAAGPEPYPLAARRVPERYELLQLSPNDLTRHLVLRLGDRACRQEDLALVRELVALADRLDCTDYLGDWLQPTLDYLADEPPPALGAFLALQSLCHGYDDPGLEPEAIAKRGAEIADRFPSSKVAPAALYQALLIGRRLVARSKDASQVDALWARLVTDYPDSPEALYAQVAGPLRRGSDDEASAAEQRLEVERRDPACDAYVRQVVDCYRYHDMANESNRRDRLKQDQAEWGRRWGKWMREADMGEAELQPMTHEGALVAELLKRLPKRELDILLEALAAEPHVYLPRSQTNEILRRHLNDPRARDVYWQGGDWESLLALVGTGPGGGAHFGEAVDKLSGWLENKEYQSHEGPRRTRGSKGLDEQLELLRPQAEQYRGTPAEVMIWEVAGRLYLLAERPEQAADLLQEALGRIEEGRLLRERLVALRQQALDIVAAKRQGIDPGP